MAIPVELLNLYRGLSAKERFYLRMRWLVSPISRVEKAVPRSGRIYDIGCGAGLLANALASASTAREVVGVDYSTEKIALAGRSIGDRKNIRFEVGDALSVSGIEADAFVACDLLHHIPYAEQERFLARAYRALAPGGALVLQDIDTVPWPKYFFAVIVDKLLGSMAPVYYRSSGSWEESLRRAGFEVVTERLDKGLPIAAVMFVCSKKSS